MLAARERARKAAEAEAERLAKLKEEAEERERQRKLVGDEWGRIDGQPANRCVCASGSASWWGRYGLTVWWPWWCALGSGVLDCAWHA